jgi:hypothetical protein
MNRGMPHRSPTERAMTLGEAARWIADRTGGRKPHVSTLSRWAIKGVRGTRLSTTRVGGRYLTTQADLASFLDTLNSPVADPAQSAAHPPRPCPDFIDGVRRQQVDAACDHLDRLCKGYALRADRQPG